MSFTGGQYRPGLRGEDAPRLELEELVAIKQRARPKDLAAVPYIESTIAERDRRRT